MKDCAKDVLAYHNDEVTLLQPQRTQMRNHRNANRDRLKARLTADNKPTPKEFIKQGSYAMLTMVQDPVNDYDIDDGVYFNQAGLRDNDRNDMAPAAARQMVCDALKDDRFNKQPQVKKNCVRIFYQGGYHVDMPVYRIRESDGEYELAAGDTWIRSRAADVEDWFNTANTTKSPDENNGRQFRRVTRDIKRFSRSREDWKDSIAAGFTITRLVEECYVPDKEREDVSLRETMRKIHDRLVLNLEVSHPVTPGSMLTCGPQDDKTKFLRDKLGEALDELAILDDPNCTRKQALAAWDAVFNTDFYSARSESEEKAAAAGNSGILANLVANRADPRAVDKRGGGRFA